MSAAAGNDLTPWRHVGGARVADPYAPDSPVGGYTFDPRPGYADHPRRFVSTRTYAAATPKRLRDGLATLGVTA